MANPDFPPATDFLTLGSGGITVDEVRTILETYGIGRKSSEVTDLDTLFTPGLYDVSASATGIPLSNNSGTVLVIAGGSGGFTQLWMRSNTLDRDRMYLRHYQGSSWSSWTHIIDEAFKASMATAIAGTDDTDYMTAQGVRQAIQSFGIGTEWNNLSGEYGYGFETQYEGDSYRVNIPVPTAQLAPPNQAGRTFTEFDGVNDYIRIPTINLQAGDVLRFKFVAPTEVVSVRQFLLDNDNLQNRFAIQFTTTGSLISSGGFTQILLDDQSVPANTPYPTDGLVHTLELTKDATVAELSNIGNRFDGVEEYQGRIYDLEVIRGGNRIHYYPLRSDAVDYIAGNLVVDEEFTYSGNWTLATGITIADNSLVFTNANNQFTAFTIPASTLTEDTYRVTYDYNITSGSLGFEVTLNGFADGETRSGSGKSDEIIILDSIGGGNLGIATRSANTTGSVKNFRVIRMNELSPSANFASSTGFTLTGGVTITGGQAVFGSGAGVKNFRFSFNALSGVKYRLTYRTNGTTTGQFNAFIGGVIDLQSHNSDGTYDIEFTPSSNGVSFGITTNNGWDGNVEYFSVTEVTDGTENGSPVKTFDYYWGMVVTATPVGVPLNSFTIATLPSAAANARVQVFVSDLAGQAAPVYSDGTTWRRYSDNTQAN